MKKLHHSQPTRRSLLSGAAALTAAAGLGVAPKAYAGPVERKFLFLYASGGWDTTTVLDPHFDTDGVDMDPDTFLGVASNLRFTNGPDRLPVERFFTRWSPFTAIVNGIDVHSVGHDSGTQFMLTGTSASSISDWPTTIAANSVHEYPMPHVVFSGPSFAGTNGASLVRAGGGTLLELLDGSINGRADDPTPETSPPSNDILDRFVHQRVAAFAARQTGMAQDRAFGLLDSLERAAELEGRRFEAGLDDLGGSLLDQVVSATDLFKLGLSRCAMVRVPGGYDTHSNATAQAINQTQMYAVLDELFDHMATTPGHTAPTLLQEVTVVAMSEFGRTPKLNGSNGKDHWPYNSVLVAGAGVAGDQVLGRTDGSLAAEPIALETGLPAANGIALGCEHVGTAILKIAGLDPENFLPGVPSLDALAKDA